LKKFVENHRDDAVGGKLWIILIVCCLTSSGKYFTHIKDEKYMNYERFVSKLKYGDIHFLYL